MGLFSSKSKSTTNLFDYSTTQTVAGQVGDDSNNNKFVAGNYTEAGLTGDNLNSVLGTVEELNSSALETTKNLGDLIAETAKDNNDLLNDIFGQTVATVQKTAETAIKETGDAYAESKSELRNFVDAVRPITLYAAIAAIFYFTFAKRA